MARREPIEEHFGRERKSSYTAENKEVIATTMSSTKSKNRAGSAFLGYFPHTAA
jgi:hypothetical protein